MTSSHLRPIKGKKITKVFTGVETVINTIIEFLDQTDKVVNILCGSDKTYFDS